MKRPISRFLRRNVDAAQIATSEAKATRTIAGQAGRYLIGAFMALAIDATIVTVLVRMDAPVLLARVLAMLAGVTTTYVFNRRYTFTPGHPASLADWGRYVAAQSVGSAINFAISTALLWLSDKSLPQIWGAVIVGAGAGFCVNFFTARRLLHNGGGESGRPPEA